VQMKISPKHMKKKGAHRKGRRSITALPNFKAREKYTAQGSMVMVQLQVCKYACTICDAHARGHAGRVSCCAVGRASHTCTHRVLPLHGAPYSHRSSPGTPFH
jgi:hypothetical protein